jgi:hypothetical protein
MESHERTVIHLQIEEQHYYFGSIKAIYNQFNSTQIGISYGSLRNFGLAENKSYTNSKCTIRKGLLKAIEGGRGKYNRNIENV